MEKLDEQRLELDLAYRYEFLKNFIGFGDEDVAAIRKVLAELVVLMPEIVKEQYHKLLAYDATARHFVERQHGCASPPPESLADLSAKHGQVKFRMDHMQSYLMQLIGHPFDSKIAVLLDAVGKMHTPKTGNPKINVPLVQMNAFMGMLADLLTERLLALNTDDDTKINCLRAFQKILWIQNDFIVRHYAAADIQSLMRMVPLFGVLTSARIDELAGLLRPRLVQPDKYIVRRGESGDSMFFITSGFVEVMVEPEPVGLGPGDFFGEIALVFGGRRTADVVTLGYCQLLELRRADFEQCLKTEPELMERLRRVAEARLQTEPPPPLHIDFS
ncbi:protoglobin domain-containing protein [Candidatus Methylomirabilis sp.]|uniref:protoglobin domain-containing protein n=1 Tax=Candidatus Methylomirabilis sp. TaxID=2032687 RepID=UPI002A6660D7|nr:protoglobin domain-containing protein [Candidatus Methylomirabilis sp.]